MRKPFVRSLIFCSLLAALGCTSILGNFEVASGDASNGTLDASTEDACPLVCGGQCVVPDRTRCGPTCSPCQDDEVCSGTCVAAPGPAFETKPLNPTGWKTADGPLTIKLKPTGVPGTIYECRTGPAASFTPQTPAWKPCDGAAGTDPIFRPEPDPASPDGTYRTEYRYRSDTYRSSAVSIVYYVHGALNGAATCPRAGHPEDGPKFSDTQYFDAAVQFSQTVGQQVNPNPFPLTGAFPALGDPSTRDDAIYLTNPFIKIPFKGVHRSESMNNITYTAGGVAIEWPAEGGDYLLNERSLRHRYVMNEARRLLLVRRQYVHPKTGDCKNTFAIGNENAATRGIPGRGRRLFHCEAFVLNAGGVGLCMGRNEAGTAPVPIVIDRKPQKALAGGYIGHNGYFALSVTNGADVVTSGTSSFTAGWVTSNYHLFLGGEWYRVIKVNKNTEVQIERPYSGVTISNSTNWKYTIGLVDIFHVPTGYAKLHSDGHGYAIGLVPPWTPSPRTKCETVGCNKDKPWLTYLPP
ncbi:MAG TPA: hypothetical protein VM580_17015 [Labilithrix sp.]|nr:hypothetical protein [Labilithrix sp.]